MKTAYILIIGLLLLSCENASKQTQHKGVEKKNSTTVTQTASKVKPSLHLELTRGAFHYDSFVIEDKTLFYLPNVEEQLLDEDTDSEKYMVKNETVLTEKQILHLTELISKRNFQSLKKKYKCLSSCSSGLQLSVKYGNLDRLVKCDDYIRDCPKILYEIEKLLIKWDGQNRIRVSLPG